MINVSKVLNVLMVYPKFPEHSFWSFKTAVEYLGLKATMPPIVLALLAAMLPKKSFNVLPIIDLNVEPLIDGAIKRADVVMLTAMTVQQDSLRQCIARVKSLGKTVVVGGPYATSYPSEALAMGADHLVLGEAELTLSQFLTDFLAGNAKQVYDEPSARACSNVEVELTREGKPVITGTPIPRWDLLRIRSYSSLAVQFSRGCPYNCEFCDIVKLFGHIPRTKTPAQMIAELEAIYKTGWRGSIFIVDDNFIGNRKEVRAFLVELVRWQKKHHYPFSFFTEASLNLAEGYMREILEMMVEAGFLDVFVGLESIDPVVLESMGKSQNKGDLGEKVRILQAAGLEVMAGVIIGNDDDQPDVCAKMFEFAQKNGIVILMSGLMEALRGTRLYDRLVKEGRLRGESGGNNTHQFSFNFSPKLNGAGMTEEMLIENYINLLKQLYSSRNHYNRCRVLRARRGQYRRPSRLNHHGITAAMRVFWRNLVQRPDWEFAKFMFEALVKSPCDLAEAITQAVKFAHFQDTTEQCVSEYHRLRVAL